jgi:hypothetical protein
MSGDLKSGPTAHAATMIMQSKNISARTWLSLSEEELLVYHILRFLCLEQFIAESN